MIQRVVVAWSSGPSQLLRRSSCFTSIPLGFSTPFNQSNNSAPADDGKSSSPEVGGRKVASGHQEGSFHPEASKTWKET